MPKPIEILAENLLQQLSYIETHTSRTSEMLAAGVRNNVLEVSTFVFDATGYKTFSWQATCGSIVVDNNGSNFVTVAASMGGTSPLQGTGMSRVAPGVWRQININSRVVTLYGTAGDSVSVQAFTTGGMSGGLLAVDGGAP